MATTMVYPMTPLALSKVFHFVHSFVQQKSVKPKRYNIKQIPTQVSPGFPQGHMHRESNWEVIPEGRRQGQEE